MLSSVEPIDTECEYVQWFKLSKHILDTDEDVYFGAVYVPPDNTKFYSREIYALFYEELEQFTTNNKHVILSGDFNARTGDLPDITDVDNCVYEQVDMETT